MSVPNTAAMRAEASAKIAAAPARPNTYLKLFWSAFYPPACSHGCEPHKQRCIGACMAPAKKLEMLRAMAEIRVRGARDEEKLKAVPKRRYEMRKNFNQTFGGFEVQCPCFLCGKPEWHHRHHMIQIQHGGGNSEANVVRLCRTCHRKVHKAS